MLPGVLAVAAYSPRLDSRGNSVRGIEACEALARTFRLHAIDPRPPAPVVRRTFDAAAVRSKRRRTPEHERLLKTGGSRVQIIEVQSPSTSAPFRR